VTGIGELIGTLALQVKSAIITTEWQQLTVTRRCRRFIYTVVSAHFTAGCWHDPGTPAEMVPRPGDLPL